MFACMYACRYVYMCVFVSATVHVSSHPISLAWSAWSSAASCMIIAHLAADVVQCNKVHCTVLQTVWKYLLNRVESHMCVCIYFCMYACMYLVHYVSMYSFIKKIYVAPIPHNCSVELMIPAKMTVSKWVYIKASEWMVCMLRVCMHVCWTYVCTYPCVCMCISLYISVCMCVRISVYKCV